MKPYYEDLASGITIYHGDCRDVLPTLDAVDLVLTDPPFGIGGSSRKGLYVGSFPDTMEYLQTVVVPVIAQAIEATASVVVTPGNKNLCLYPQPDSFGCFYQKGGSGFQRFGNVDAQPIFYYGQLLAGTNAGRPCSYELRGGVMETYGHPCPKPLKPWRQLLQNVSGSGSVILDPFMGSGTTLRAAKDLGRKAIGIEISEEYCEIAARRLSQSVMDFGVPV